MCFLDPTTDAEIIGLKFFETYLSKVSREASSIQFHVTYAYIYPIKSSFIA